MNPTIWYESILISLRHLKSHPLRTFLTILGFTAALASLLAMVGIGEGTRKKVLNKIELLGSASVISVQINRKIINDPTYVVGQENKLTQDDIDIIRQTSSHITQIVPTAIRPMEFRHNKNIFKGQSIGTTPQYLSILNWQTDIGRFIGDADLYTKNRVCVIGSDVRRELFGDANPIGKNLNLGGIEFTVIGAMAPTTMTVRQILNEAVITPLGLQLRETGETRFSEIHVQVEDISIIPVVQQQILQMLQEKYTSIEQFKVISQSEAIDTLSQLSTLMEFTFTIISMIILFVGGIGIMNLMLVSVTERTKEIGVYKAVGAKDGDIFRLFLFEAIMMSCLGGIVGIILGVSCSKFIAKLTDIVLHNKIESIISIKILTMAVIASILLGIFFGLYPARNAARIDPGKALRYE